MRRRRHDPKLDRTADVLANLIEHGVHNCGDDECFSDAEIEAARQELVVLRLMAAAYTAEVRARARML